MPQKSIQALFIDICDQARWDGYLMFGMLSSLRRNKDHPERKPGLFYSRLPEEVKERIRKELKSEHAQSPLKDMLLYGDIIPYDVDTNRHIDYWKREMLKFEHELMKHGWKPNFKL
jgi:hypothetical protein